MHGRFPILLDNFIEICMHVYAVGTNVGEIAIWEVSTCERLALKPFKVWDLSLCSIALQVSAVSSGFLANIFHSNNNCELQNQAALVKDPAVSVNRTMWSPDGDFLGQVSSESSLFTELSPL